MKTNLKLNYILNMTYQCLNVLVSIVTAPYLARVLGAEGVGANSYALSMATYFTLFANMGSAMYAQRRIAGCQSDRHDRSLAFWDVLCFRGISTTAACLFYVAYILAARPANLTLAWIYLIYVLCVAFDVSWIFQGMEDFFTVVSRNLFIKLINVAVIFVFIKDAGDLKIYCFSYVVLMLAANLSTFLRLPAYVGRVKIKEIRPFRGFGDMMALFVPTIAIQIYTILDKTMIGWFSDGSAENGYYSQTESLVKICITVISSLTTVMFPRMSRLYAEGESEKAGQYMSKSFSFLWLMSIPMCLGLECIADVFIPVFFGPGYEKSITLMYILAPIIVMVGISSIVGFQLLLPRRMQREYTASVVSGALINLAVNLILIPRLFSVGAAVGTLVAETVVSAVQLGCVRKNRVISMRTVFGCSRNYLVSGLIMTALLFFIKRFVGTNVAGLLILLALGVIIYAGVLIILCDRIVMDLLKNFRNRFRH